MTEQEKRTLQNVKMLRLREELSNIEEDWLRGEPGFSVDEAASMMRRAMKDPEKTILQHP